MTDLADLVQRLRRLSVPFHLLGGGSNGLVSDQGVRSVVVLDPARQVRFREQANPPTVWAESGTNFGALARRAAARGLSGLEWAAGIPGTIGGAVVGNAGAHGGDMSGCLVMAEILHLQQAGAQAPYARSEWLVDKFEFAYRSSLPKTPPGPPVRLSAVLRL